VNVRVLRNRLRRVIDAPQAIGIIGAPNSIRACHSQGAIENMDKSPWSAYGRPQKDTDPSAASSGKPDPTFGAAREVMLTHEQLKHYLTRTLQEFNEIRAGRAGYTRMVSEALKPPPRPESIEETLRRLAATSTRAGHRRRDDSSRSR
jgi:hypothetical protein